MSTLGQEQTFAAQKGVSALHPIADISGAPLNGGYVVDTVVVQSTMGHIVTTKRK
jgi:hypothetical protein